MLAALSKVSGPLPNARWLRTANTNGTYYAQDFIAPVPEPATLLLLAGGLAGMTRFNGRRARKKLAV